MLSIAWCTKGGAKDNYERTFSSIKHVNTGLLDEIGKWGNLGVLKEAMGVGLSHS
jgi:hypothetical protein